MNGRMYDPVIGRILSPDKAVQAPGYTQSYNRYSYCMNNPLRYTDPSGWYVADGTSWGRDIIELRGTTFYDYGIGFPGNYYSGRGSNTSIGPQGYRYVGGGVYMDVGTGKGVDFGTVYDKYILPNSYDGQGLLDQWRENYHRNKAYEDKNALAAASNIGYGKSFGGPFGGDPNDPTISFDLSFKYGFGLGYKVSGLLGLEIDILAVSFLNLHFDDKNGFSVLPLDEYSSIEYNVPFASIGDKVSYMNNSNEAHAQLGLVRNSFNSKTGKNSCLSISHAGGFLGVVGMEGSLNMNLSRVMNNYVNVSNDYYNTLGYNIFSFTH
jgi:hypothetical protein